MRIVGVNNVAVNVQNVEWARASVSASVSLCTLCAEQSSYWSFWKMREVNFVTVVADVKMNEINGKRLLFWHLLIRFYFARAPPNTHTQRNRWSIKRNTLRTRENGETFFIKSSLCAFWNWKCGSKQAIWSCHYKHKWTTMLVYESVVLYIENSHFNECDEEICFHLLAVYQQHADASVQIDSVYERLVCIIHVEQKSAFLNAQAQKRQNTIAMLPQKWQRNAVKCTQYIANVWEHFTMN